MSRKWSHVCSECNEIFDADPQSNVFCRKCQKAEILCPPCRFIHEQSASAAERYFNDLEHELRLNHD